MSTKHLGMYRDFTNQQIHFSVVAVVETERLNEISNSLKVAQLVTSRTRTLN